MCRQRLPSAKITGVKPHRNLRSQLGAFSRNAALTPDDYEMLVIASKNMLNSISSVVYYF
jgi:hypothetical protein